MNMCLCIALNLSFGFVSAMDFYTITIPIKEEVRSKINVSLQSDLIKAVSAEYQAPFAGVTTSNTSRAGSLYAGWYLQINQLFPSEIIEQILKFTDSSPKMHKYLEYDRCSLNEIPRYDYWSIGVQKSGMYKVRNLVAGIDDVYQNLNIVLKSMPDSEVAENSMLSINNCLKEGGNPVFVKLVNTDVYCGIRSSDSKGFLIVLKNNCERSYYVLPELVDRDEYEEIIFSPDDQCVYLVPEDNAIDRYVTNRIGLSRVLSPWVITYGRSDIHWFSKRVFKKNRIAFVVKTKKHFDMMFDCITSSIALGCVGLSAMAGYYLFANYLN